MNFGHLIEDLILASVAQELISNLAAHDQRNYLAYTNEICSSVCHAAWFNKRGALVIMSVLVVVLNTELVG